MVGLGWEGVGGLLVQTLDFSITEEFCRRSFFSSMVEGMADAMWAASSLCSRVNRHL